MSCFVLLSPAFSWPVKRVFMGWKTGRLPWHPPELQVKSLEEEVMGGRSTHPLNNPFIQSSPGVYSPSDVFSVCSVVLSPLSFLSLWSLSFSTGSLRSSLLFSQHLLRFSFLFSDYRCILFCLLLSTLVFLSFLFPSVSSLSLRVSWFLLYFSFHISFVCLFNFLPFFSLLLLLFCSYLLCFFSSSTPLLFSSSSLLILPFSLLLLLFLFFFFSSSSSFLFSSPLLLLLLLLSFSLLLLHSFSLLLFLLLFSPFLFFVFFSPFLFSSFP